MLLASLPVTKLATSVAFYEVIGFRTGAERADEMAACLVWSETISAMLLFHGKWRRFTSRPVPVQTLSEGDAGAVVRCLPRREH